MPAPRNPKEIKEFLGIVGYYQKFIPRFSDIAKPLTRLMRHDMTFEWCKRCEFSFQTEGCTMHRTHIKISRYKQTICVVHRCLQTCKCSFMKMHIEYLGHLILEKGTEPMLDKLSVIKRCQHPETPKKSKSS